MIKDVQLSMENEVEDDKLEEDEEEESEGEEWTFSNVRKVRKVRKARRVSKVKENPMARKGVINRIMTPIIIIITQMVMVKVHLTKNLQANDLSRNNITTISPGINQNQGVNHNNGHHWRYGGGKGNKHYKKHYKKYNKYKRSYNVD